MEGDHAQVMGKDAPQRIDKHHFDRLGLSGKLLMALSLTTLLFLTIPILDNYVRPVDDRPGHVIRTLNLMNLSILGSGRPIRHPESIVASVNLHFSPVVFDFMINPEYLLLNPPQYFKDHIVQ
jgi:hypothetical protein